nr:unnamed protein product [Digitaria exilis]
MAQIPLLYLPYLFPPLFPHLLLLPPPVSSSHHHPAPPPTHSRHPAPLLPELRLGPSPHALAPPAISVLAPAQAQPVSLSPHRQPRCPTPTSCAGQVCHHRPSFCDHNPKTITSLEISPESGNGFE